MRILVNTIDDELRHAPMTASSRETSMGTRSEAPTALSPASRTLMT